MKDDLSSKDFDDFVKAGVVAVDFWAEWCGPCKMMGPVFEESSKDLGEKASFGKVNVDSNQDLAQRFQVMSIPTIILFKDGEQVDRVSGVISKEELIKKVEDIK